jgi:hypothetical protein
MPVFLCLVIGRSNEVVKVETIEADAAAEAMTRMEQHIRSDPLVTTIEIWLQGRLELRLALNKLRRETIAAKSIGSDS